MSTEAVGILFLVLSNLLFVGLLWWRSSLVNKRLASLQATAEKNREALKGLRYRLEKSSRTLKEVTDKILEIDFELSDSSEFKERLDAVDKIDNFDQILFADPSVESKENEEGASPNGAQ